MYQLGPSSLKRLEECDPRLKQLCEEVIKVIDFTVMVGHRNEADQNKAFAEGKSKLKFPNSKHNSFPSKAIDIAPYPVDWNDLKRFYYLAGIVKAKAHELGIKVRWGGDWDSDNDFKDNSFNDLPHFELVD